MRSRRWGWGGRNREGEQASSAGARGASPAGQSSVQNRARFWPEAEKRHCHGRQRRAERDSHRNMKGQCAFQDAWRCDSARLLPLQWPKDMLEEVEGNSLSCSFLGGGAGCDLRRAGAWLLLEPLPQWFCSVCRCITGDYISQAPLLSHCLVGSANGKP